MKRFVPIGLAAALALGSLAGSASAQQANAPAAAPAAAPAPAPAARPADVASVDGIIAALYDVISGPAGAPRDWNRMRSLFAPEAHLMAVGMRPDGTVVTRAMTVEDYITRNAPHFATMGFFERELARTSDSFGQVAHVFSTYESRHAPGDAKPFARGINSIQLFNDGKRWWVANLVWRGEDDKLKLPERYLHNN
jgi:hypothetical protein